MPNVSNLERFRGDLDRLSRDGDLLEISLRKWHDSAALVEMLTRGLNDSVKAVEVVKNTRDFSEAYQSWYSEALVVVKILIPARLQDFTGHYGVGRPRKTLDADNYRIHDAVVGLQLNDLSVNALNALPHVRAQLAILKSARQRFTSSLFEIRQLIQADMFDSDLDSARALAKKGFTRAAGALAGVVLEKHLGQVCDDHTLSIGKKNPTINDHNDLLKNNEVIDVPQWRHIQLLGDIRNLCDHGKTQEPTKDQVSDLIEGTAKVTKTVF